jgi:hypothetical protein
MIRRIILVVTVLVVFGSVPVGLAAPAAAQDSDAADSSGAFGTNVSLSLDIREGIEDEEQEFKNASRQVKKESENLRDTADKIASTSSYTATNHNRANESLSEIEHGLENLRGAESEAASKLQANDVTPAERFLVLREVDREKNATLMAANNAFSQYESALKEKRDDARSTVYTYFGGGLLIGLFGGLLLGGAVPLIEARNVRDQMKLSRDVSYNRRAGIIPAVVGIVLLIGGIGLLWYLGAIDLVRVMI